ncbi:MAG: hypothetical protein HDQ97_19405 [Lachnospiraceae bacterium]|nr:hypothetical protein [Lachnospiraceae bacterium]
MTNNALIDKTVEITVAKVSTVADSTAAVSEASGKMIAEFMQVIYDKLCELNTDSN